MLKYPSKIISFIELKFADIVREDVSLKDM